MALPSIRLTCGVKLDLPLTLPNGTALRAGQLRVTYRARRERGQRGARFGGNRGSLRAIRRYGAIAVAMTDGRQEGTSAATSVRAGCPIFSSRQQSARDC